MRRGRWSVAEAKAKFSQLVADAEQEAQIVERRGQEVAVVLSASAYESLRSAAARGQPEARWQAFMELSAAVRAAGGAELALPKRRARPSPFGRAGSRNR